MALVELTMPAMGEAVMEATILKWLKQVGDTVAEEEPVVEIATDKVDSEILANASGTIKELFFKENEVAAVGAKIALIETEEEGAVSKNPSVEIVSEIKPFEDMVNKQEADVPYIPEDTLITEASPSSEKNSGFYSPLVLSIARKENVDFKELAAIQGTGNDGRLTKKDLLNYLENKNTHQPATPAVATNEETITAPANQNVTADTENKSKEIAPAQKKIIVGNTTYVAVQTPAEYTMPSYPPNNGNTEIVEMDRMRKMIAHHMKDSQNTSATVTSFAEVDVTNMVLWRNSVKQDFEKREQTKLTFTPLFIECVTRVIKRFPLINSSVENDKIIIKKNINIGMATALPNGNLIVPVIRDVDYLNLVGLTKKVNTIANNARNNQLSPGDTQDGTFTITNVGNYGSLTGTPIIHQPQVAILAIGTIKKRPVVIESPSGDVIGIRSMAILALSYDHRIIDGALGSTFLHEVVKEIEGWDVKRVF
jgi:2-oxoglutarate dehydrogenase E2 component (dihydrolipoamide succinyltransferase)